jgi:hypothetical protein
MNYIGDRNADKAFLIIFSTPTCKALTCSFYLVSFSLGCADTSLLILLHFCCFILQRIRGRCSCQCIRGEEGG